MLSRGDTATVTIPVFIGMAPDRTLIGRVKCTAPDIYRAYRLDPPVGYGERTYTFISVSSTFGRACRKIEDDYYS